MHYMHKICGSRNCEKQYFGVLHIGKALRVYLDAADMHAVCIHLLFVVSGSRVTGAKVILLVSLMTLVFSATKIK